MGHLSPAAVRVSHAMLGFIRGNDICCASTSTLATHLQLSDRAVKAARRRLIDLELWLVSNNSGGKARGADYQPNRKALGLSEHEDETALPDANSEQAVHPNLPVGGVPTPQDQARDGTLPSENTPKRVLGSLSSRGLSPKCRARRLRGAADRVGQVPQSVSYPSSSRAEGSAS
jgi:hypothetical protein